jgi:hypothetical protein
MITPSHATDHLILRAELFKTEGSADQVLSDAKPVSRRLEDRTRYFWGFYHGERCFIKQYIGDPARAEVEYAICMRRSCRQIARPLFLQHDIVGFEYVEGRRLSDLDRVPEPDMFVREFARGMYDICNVLGMSLHYDFHTNNAILQENSRLVFVDFVPKPQPQKLRPFLEGCLRKAGQPRWLIWQLTRKRGEDLGRKLLRVYLPGEGAAYGRL